MYLHAVTSRYIQNYIDYFKFISLFVFLVFFMALYIKKTFFTKNDRDGNKSLIYCGNRMKLHSIWVFGDPSCCGFLGSK